jgi:ATP synthase subunit 6
LTSSFIVTLFLAATHFIGINIIGSYKQSWQFLNLFLPSGVPLFIAPFLILIEVISYFAKVLSLSIRLFANMMSGHALLKILIGFSWVLCSTFSPVFIGLGLFPWIIVTLILFLEALIAFLQAYVFVVLIAIYLNDVTSSH